LLLFCEIFFFLYYKALANKAREGRLLPEEYQGGTFSISNLGMFGITEFSAVINPPQVAILAVGSSASRVKSQNSGFESQSLLRVTLSIDERAVNDVDAAQFLEYFGKVLAEPKLLM
jgi:pyruvate/2-oxoglutarate dehydrogenase complex dihydrolipoamide acyltransferase (E2) component